MTDFDTLKSQWNNQKGLEPKSEDFTQVTKKLKGVRLKQRMTNLVLLATFGVLVFFFIYISAYKNTTLTIGLSLMMGSLLLRVLIESFSMRKLKSMDALMDVNKFKKKLIAYYKNRTRTHYVATPIIVLAYSIGFVILLPLFKKNLSSGFYNYIVISAIVVLLVLGVLIIKTIKEELRELRALQQPE